MQGFTWITLGYIFFLIFMISVRNIKDLRWSFYAGFSSSVYVSVIGLFQIITEDGQFMKWSGAALFVFGGWLANKYWVDYHKFAKEEKRLLKAIEDLKARINKTFYERRN